MAKKTVSRKATPKRSLPRTRTAPKDAGAKKAAGKRAAKVAAKGTPRRSPAKRLHTVRFPNESTAYRTRRDALLRAEMDLRRRIETVAALRRSLPSGGITPEDYVFDEAPIAHPTNVKQARMSELFGDGPTLLVYSFMFGPDDAAACPSCTSILDALDGSSPHVNQRVPFVVIAKSPIARILAHARQRGWRNLRLLSSFGSNYNRDYKGETEEGNQIPSLNAFVKRDGEIRHFYNTELLFAPWEKGQEPRHVDLIWPIWNLFDNTPEGRGTDWRPQLSYD